MILKSRYCYLRPAPSGAHGHHRVTNIELFFDLVFVFAVTQLSHLLIGNFMKTTLHGLHELNEGRGSFIYSVAKYADNGLAESNAEVEAYLAEYRRRAGVDYLISALEDKSRGFITRFAAVSQSRVNWS